MEKIELSISEVLDKAWELTKKYGLILAVIYLVFSLIYEGISLCGLPSGYWEAVMSQDAAAIERMSNESGFSPLTPVLWIFAFVFSAGFMNMILLVAKGETSSPSFSAFKMEVMTYLKFLAIEIITGLVIVVGFVCLIVPGLYLAARLMFAPLYILENPNVGIGDAISASWKMTEGNVLVLIGLGIISIFIAILGLLACCIGMYYTIVIAYFCEIVAYLMLKENLKTVE